MNDYEVKTNSQGLAIAVGETQEQAGSQFFPNQARGSRNYHGRQF